MLLCLEPILAFFKFCNAYIVVFVLFKMFSDVKKKGNKLSKGRVRDAILLRQNRFLRSSS